MNNPFISRKQQDDIMGVFCNIQKLTYAVYRLKNAWRFKRARLYNTDDLYMNPISPTDKNVIVLLQNNTRYVFHIRELIQGTQTALSHCCHFFSDALVIKNPYTNLPFTKSALYNIYFAIRASTYIIPVLFHRYFLANFSYGQFSIDNEDLINEYHLKTYVENHCLTHIYDEVREMFKAHNIRCNVHKTFSKSALYATMQPYLKLFYISNYAMNGVKKHRAHLRLKRKLTAFASFNPNYGRRKARFADAPPFSTVRKCTYYFDEAAAPFMDKVEKSAHIHTFMKTHLKMVEPIQLSNNAANFVRQEDIREAISEDTSISDYEFRSASHIENDDYYSDGEDGGQEGIEYAESASSEDDSDDE